MKKIVSSLILIILILFISIIFILSTSGIETNKFNKFISNKINQSNSDINLELEQIIFKLDIKKISIFLETKKSQINYKGVKIPTKNIKAYIDFISIINFEPKIKKVNLIFSQLDINQLKKLSSVFRPSNYTSFINNKVEKGNLNLNLEVYLNQDNLLYDFIVRGSVSNFKLNIFNEINLHKFKFNFFGDKKDFLIKNIFGETNFFTITEGDVRLKLFPEISLNSNFNSNIKYREKKINKKNFTKYLKFINDLKILDANLINTISMSFDKTYKIKKYNYQGNGKIINSSFHFKKPFLNPLSKSEINQLSIKNSKIKINAIKGKTNTILSGKYSLNKSNFLNFNLESYLKKEISNLKFDVDYDDSVFFEIINYEKKKGNIAKLFVDMNIQMNNLKIKKINFTNDEDSILLEDINLKNNLFSSFKKVLVKTSKDGKKNNEFSILNNKMIIIKGNKLDASNLAKIFNKNNLKNRFSLLNKDIQIEISDVIAPLSKKLKNFKLIGKIEKGKFSKISSKGDFGNNNFLDIKLEKNKQSQEKILEIYSDLTQPLLTEYSFFKGLKGGKLLFTSNIGDNTSNSKLKIENFKIVRAPGLVKLLALADLNGLADLAEGEGISFDSLEINMSKSKNLLKLHEIIALGSSMSVLMEGYTSKDITSIRGTLVPAKALNRMISKIPVLGDLVIPKEVGEGLFGISFKMKGPPGKIKTTINPIRTLTPRFIQKIIENKNSK